MLQHVDSLRQNVSGMVERVGMEALTNDREVRIRSSDFVSNEFSIGGKRV